MRALNAFAGFILITIGMIVTFATWTADGWTALALVGVLMLATDLVLEDRAETRRRAVRS